jgi:thiol-disulfide isomerase/thioredoxin
MRLPAVLASLLLLAACSDRPKLAQGAAAPDFSLPGVDGKTHALAEFAGSRVLAVVFTGNSCPASQLYESRLRKLAADYRDKGLTLVAINPNRPAALQPQDLSHSDVGESLDDMKARAAYRHIGYPYLADGDAQAAARAFGVVTTPHIFVFDQARKLQYEGRIDDNLREDAVTSSDARNAIDAVLAGREAPVARTKPTGCAVKGLGDTTAANQTAAEPNNGDVPLTMAGAEELKKLRQNGTGKLLLVNFWATWCVPCAAEFPELETTYRMYRSRNLEFVTVSVNDPEERPAVLQFLKEHRAAHDNRLFATSDVYGLQAAFDPQMPSPVPFTLLLAPNGDVLYQELGELTTLKLRRAILANLPEDPQFPGHRAYWAN